MLREGIVTLLAYLLDELYVLGIKLFDCINVCQLLKLLKLALLDV